MGTVLICLMPSLPPCKTSHALSVGGCAQVVAKAVLRRGSSAMNWCGPSALYFLWIVSSEVVGLKASRYCDVSECHVG